MSSGALFAKFILAFYLPRHRLRTKNEKSMIWNTLRNLTHADKQRAYEVVHFANQLLNTKPYPKIKANSSGNK